MILCFHQVGLERWEVMVYRFVRVIATVALLETRSNEGLGSEQMEHKVLIWLYRPPYIFN